MALGSRNKEPGGRSFAGEVALGWRAPAATAALQRVSVEGAIDY